MTVRSRLAGRRAEASAPSLRAAVLLTIGGLFFGIVTSSASDSGILWLLDMVSWPAIYIAILVMLIRASPSSRIAAANVVAVFVPFVIAYYGTMLLSFGTFPRTYALVWLIGAALLGPASALLSRVLHRGGRTASLASALLASAALADGSLLLLLQNGDDDARAHAIQIVLDLVAASWVIFVMNGSARNRVVAGAAFVVLGAAVLALGPTLHYGLSRFR